MFRSGGDGPIGVETAEVINADHIIKERGVFHPLPPPQKERLPMSGPVIEGISPVLPHLGKGVRRYARNRGGQKVFVQLEELGAGPHLGGVGRDVDGQIPQDRDIPVVGIGLEGAPLPEKVVLKEDLKVDLIGQVSAAAVQRVGLSAPDYIRPLIQRLAEMVMERAEEGVVREPVRLGLQESGAGRSVAVAGPSPAEKGQAGGVEPCVVHVVRIGAASGGELLPGKQPQRRKVLQIQKPRVSGKGGGRHIGGIAAPRGNKGKNLPHVLMGVGEKVDETPGFPTQ